MIPALSLAALPATAALLTVDPLTQASFEEPVVDEGIQNETMTGWTSNNTGSRVMNPSDVQFADQFNGNSRNVPDGAQCAVIFNGSVANQLGWANQTILGTTSADPSIHALTGDEAAGRTIRVTFWAGRGLATSTYEDEDFHFNIGLQAQNTLSWHDQAQYTKERLIN